MVNLYTKEYNQYNSVTGKIFTTCDCLLKSKTNGIKVFKNIDQSDFFNNRSVSSSDSESKLKYLVLYQKPCIHLFVRDIHLHCLEVLQYEQGLNLYSDRFKSTINYINGIPISSSGFRTGPDGPYRRNGRPTEIQSLKLLEIFDHATFPSQFIIVCG